MALPNLIIIGPPKCGTTSIFDWLSKHPDACPSRVKETNYFFDQIVKSNKGANFLTHGLDRYEDQFPGFQGQKIVFESSPGYLSCDIPIQAFAKFDPPPFVLFIFRNPAERLYSEYRFSKFKTRSFKGSFSDYCGAELTREKVKDGKIVSRINHWINAYDPEKMIICHFGELEKNPEDFMKSLCNRLGIDPKFYSAFKFDAKNKTVVRRSNWAHKVADKFYKFFPEWSKKAILPIYRRINQTSLPDPTNEDLKIIDRLRDHFKNETWENIQT